MSVPLDSKVFPITAAVNDDGHLEIGGCDVTSLAREFGTPLYVFDEATLRNQAEGFLRRLPLPLPRKPRRLRLQGVHQRAARALPRGPRPRVRRRLRRRGCGAARRGRRPRHGGLPRQQQDPRGDRTGSRLGRWDLRDRQLPRAAPAERGRGCGGASAARPHPRLALHRPAHAPPHHDGRARQQVRLPHRDRRRRGGGPAGDGRAQPGPAGHPLPTSARPSSSWSRTPRRSSGCCGSRPAWANTAWRCAASAPAAASPSPTRRTTSPPRSTTTPRPSLPNSRAAARPTTSLSRS